MSTPLEPIVPAPLRRELDVDPPADEGFTILVLTAGGGWPHLAMISRGELVCRSDRLLLLALWPTSTAGANISASGRATLCAVLDGVAYSIRVVGRRLADISTPLAGTLACFRAEVDAVTGDQAPYAALDSGIRFTLLEPEATLQRWREVRAALRSVEEPP